MTDPFGRRCRVEVVPAGAGLWVGIATAGDVILRQTRAWGDPAPARQEIEDWLVIYLKTGSWNAATDGGVPA